MSTTKAGTTQRLAQYSRARPTVLKDEMKKSQMKSFIAIVLSKLSSLVQDKLGTLSVPVI